MFTKKLRPVLCCSQLRTTSLPPARRAEALALTFAFDDTQDFLEAPGSREIVYYVIGAETIVKVAAGVMHIAAVQTEHTHG
ncbi:MAG: hypothetical protein LC794_19585 [Acidobacteria bacterium]|nr:hypothetical protein [Acidobacteriota bacterium]